MLLSKRFERFMDTWFFWTVTVGTVVTFVVQGIRGWLN